MTKLYVGRLSGEVTDKDLTTLFAPFRVQSVAIARDGTTKQSLGHAFVEIDGDGARAVATIDGRELHGRSIVVRVVQD